MKANEARKITKKVREDTQPPIINKAIKDIDAYILKAAKEGINVYTTYLDGELTKNSISIILKHYRNEGYKMWANLIPGEEGEEYSEPSWNVQIQW